MLCSDGWRKKAAKQGTPLVNVVLLKPDRGIIFIKAIDTSGKKKTGVAIKDMHLEMAQEVTQGDPAKILGVVMDNPKANRLALKLLQDAHPTWICLGCQAHALNLLCKDLITEKFCPGTSAVLITVLKISLVIGDAEVIRTALGEWQKDQYGKTKAIAAHCPTRFAITFKIAQDLMASQGALRQMIESDEWPELAKCSINSSVFDNLKSGKILQFALVCPRAGLAPCKFDWSPCKQQ